MKDQTSESLTRFDVVLVFDFGGQYCHLIARRVREQGVYSEIVPCDITTEKILGMTTRFNVKGIILSGGPTSVYADNAPKLDPEILSLDIPILGLCYGHQLIAHLSGGRVEQAIKREYGSTYVTIDKPEGILKGLNRSENVWMSHGDVVYDLPPGFEVMAHTDNSPVAAFCNNKRPLYGLQWHPEVSHTENGDLMLRNFIFRVCGCKKNWSIKDFGDRAISEVRRVVGDGRCIVALSGGVDSSLAAVLAARAIGKRLTAVFVDHGLMREDEPKFVEEIFARLGVHLILINAQKRFLRKLQGVTDPEMKRKIIGREFIRVFEEVARNTGAEYLIQGTIYPDRIESGAREHSEKIKTHHNVAGLPTRIKFKAIVEPLRDLYKDEVRKVAETLGLPSEIVWRQPFPGPGLGVRIVGLITEEKVDLVRKADRIVVEEIEKVGLQKSLWQYFAVLTDTKSTGVKGDARAYGYTVAVRAVESREAMTANFAEIPYDILEKISTRITNELSSITRVVYDITHKPPTTIEWE